CPQFILGARRSPLFPYTTLFRSEPASRVGLIQVLGLIRGRSMYYMEIALLVAGVIVLVIGYRKNRRNVLLTAAVLLFLAGALGKIGRASCRERVWRSV